MGRYIAAGVACEILIRKYKYVTSDKFMSLKEKIKENIEKHIDVKHYKVIENEEWILYRIKPSVVNEYLNDLLKEVDPILDLSSYFFYNLYYDIKTDINIKSETFRDDFPLKFVYFDDNYKYENDYEKSKFHNNYGLIPENKENTISTTSPFYVENVWMIFENSELINCINIDTEYLMLWSDYNKIDGEDESKVLQLLNLFVKNYFKTPLSKDLQFFIEG